MERVLEVDLTVLNFLIGSVIPLLTALLTKFSASSTIKAVFSLGLSIGVGVVNTLVAADGKASIGVLAASAITVYLAHGVSYNNLLKPTGLAGSVKNVAPNFGLGTNETALTGHGTDPAAPYENF